MLPSLLDKDRLGELLKVSTGTAISSLAPLLSDNLPSGYVVVPAVSDIVLGMLGFPRHCLGLKT